jgi:uncharacterized phage protein (TIGR02218 family)
VTYQALEEGTESGRPVETYKFTIGSTVYRYTSAPFDHQPPYDSNDYFSRAISRTSAKQTTEDRRTPLEITLPTDDALAQRFIDVPPGPEVTLEITRYHIGDTEAYVIWSGRIIGAAYLQEGGVCTLSGVTDEAAFSRSIPRFKYQGLCNHVLYDTLCTVARASFKYTGTVSAVVGNTITVSGLSAKGADWAVGGYVDNGASDYRLVVSQSGDILTLFLPFETSPLGSSVDVYAGCNHTIDVCTSKFSNAVNYGGFPFVPTFNPFDRGL